MLWPIHPIFIVTIACLLLILLLAKDNTGKKFLIKKIRNFTIILINVLFIILFINLLGKLFKLITIAWKFSYQSNAWDLLGTISLLIILLILISMIGYPSEDTSKRKSISKKKG